MILDIPLTCAQNAIGKAGPAGIPPAMSDLALWTRSCSSQAVQATLIAAKLIHSLYPVRKEANGERKLASAHIDTGPCSIITFFLCHVTLWTFVCVAGSRQKRVLLELLKQEDGLSKSPLFLVLKQVLLSGDAAEEGGLSREDAMKLVFRSASEGLTRMGTWGCALNLAMLLHRRAEM
jgi:hypothetical protein